MVLEQFAMILPFVVPVCGYATNLAIQECSLHAMFIRIKEFNRTDD